jgi:hypothetical protein
MLLSCSDGTGPPDFQDQPSLGAIAGPGVSGSQLHPLSHRMHVVTSDGEHPFQQLLLQAASSTAQETPAMSFWAVRGEEQTFEIGYRADGDTATGEFLRFHIPAAGLLLQPNGTAFAAGDSVLITVTIDPSEFHLEFGPSGLVFNDQAPAQLELWYSAAEGDIPQSQLGMWYQQEAGTLWYPIVSQHQLDRMWFKTVLFHFSGYVISWNPSKK